MPEEYTFRRVSAERLKDIKYLYSKCFGEEVQMDFLEKKYNTKDFGACDIGYIAYDTSGNPAAYYGAFPCRAVIRGKTYLCAQSGDTMTHPDHRGKGLFVSLALAAYKLARESGIKFVFGFPNENSYPGFIKKLGWIHKENLNTYKLKVLTLPLAYVCSRLKFLSSLYSAYAGFILKNKLSKKKYFDNPLVSNSDGGLLRDETFFNYKNYIKKELIEINGKCVYIKIAGSLTVGDIEKTGEEAFYKIIKKLKGIAWLLGCYAVVFRYSPLVNYDRFLAKKFDENCSKGSPVGWVDFESGLPLDSLKFSQADLDTY
jgi:GNAT superfamily N-acetyltransferase